MKLSIIVPIYNVAFWIEGCIQSIVAQTRRDFELILVDDCSPDESMVIARKTLQECSVDFPFIELRHEHNRGLSAARNTGIAAATGEWMLFVDSDDLLMPQCVELLLGKAESSKADLVIGEILVRKNGKDENVWHVPFKGDDCIGRDNIITSYLNQQWYVMVWNKLVRSDFLNNNNLIFDEELRIHEDGEWSFKTHCLTEHVAIVHSPTYVYQVRDNSIQNDKNLTRHLDYCMKVQGIIDGYAKQYGVTYLPIYKKWQDKTKSWIYGLYVKPQQNERINERFYNFVRTVAPNPRLTISHFHYYVCPYRLGFWLYKKTVGHLWAY